MGILILRYGLSLMEKLWVFGPQAAPCYLLMAGNGLIERRDGGPGVMGYKSR